MRMKVIPHPSQFLIKYLGKQNSGEVQEIEILWGLRQVLPGHAEEVPQQVPLQHLYPQ